VEKHSIFMAAFFGESASSYSDFPAKPKGDSYPKVGDQLQRGNRFVYWRI
jgi:hypothetical protein